MNSAGATEQRHVGMGIIIICCLCQWDPMEIWPPSLGNTEAEEWTGPGAVYAEIDEWGRGRGC